MISTAVVKNGDVLVLNIPGGNMPRRYREDYFESVRRSVKSIFPENKVLVLDDQVELTILRTSTD
jgi:hypothetical protein